MTDDGGEEQQEEAAADSISSALRRPPANTGDADPHYRRVPILAGWPNSHLEHELPPPSVLALLALALNWPLESPE